MNSKLRVLIPLGLVALAGIAYAFHVSIGTPSAFGWEDIAAICPLGALGTMLASKTIIPRAVISLILAVLVIFLVGRAICAWVCPVPVVSRLRNILKNKEVISVDVDGKEKQEVIETITGMDGQKVALVLDSEDEDDGDSANGHECKSISCSTDSCSSCKDMRNKLVNLKNDSLEDSRTPSSSRNIVLGTSLLGAFIFGFPVFCLVCPIGLTFASVFLLINLFGTGDATWSVVVIPALLLVEVVFFRKWCSKICPLSALMSLVARANKTFIPKVNTAECIETTRGVKCGKCEKVCEVAINPRHPELGTSFNECTRCRECVEICPAKAISIPFYKSKKGTNIEAS